MVNTKDRNLVAVVCYLLGFVTGVVVLAVEKEDKFIRFHAAQSTVTFGFLFLLNIILGNTLGTFSFWGILSVGANFLVLVVAVLIWIVSMVWAYQGKIFKWPLAGDWAQKLVGKST